MPWFTGHFLCRRKTDVQTQSEAGSQWQSEDIGNSIIPDLKILEDGLAGALRKKGIAVKEIAEEVERDRSTIYRWVKGIGRYGLEGYVRRYRSAKKGRQVRKTHPYLEQRVLSIRREYRNCCGQKVVHLLKQEGIELSLSTVY